jgi:uncharacterized DUF497 family protein
LLDKTLPDNYTAIIGELRFEWNRKKNAGNITKHKISFETAITAFADPFGIIIADPDHSDFEERFILIGLNTELKLLVVCHCYLQPDETIRIISARNATIAEKKNYGGNTNARRI